MRRLFAGMVLSAATLLLSGCYVDPGYSYVRRTAYQGDAYYGQATPSYDGGYYVAPFYGPSYGRGYGYGCCYAPGIGVGAVWYGRTRYYRAGRPVYPRYDRARGYQGGGRNVPRNAGPRHGQGRAGGHWTRRGRSNGA